jgi:hypothetical protein
VLAREKNSLEGGWENSIILFNEVTSRILQLNNVVNQNV